MFKNVKTNSVQISKEYVLEESSFSKRINLFEKICGLNSLGKVKGRNIGI
jgi:hypothetical protein